jgi:hypothetical protein
LTKYFSGGEIKSIKMIFFSLAISLILEGEQMDVKITLEKPQGFLVKDKEDYACKLKKIHMA